MRRNYSCYSRFWCGYARGRRDGYERGHVRPMYKIQISRSLETSQHRFLTLPLFDPLRSFFAYSPCGLASRFRSDACMWVLDLGLWGWGDGEILFLG